MSGFVVQKVLAVPLVFLESPVKHLEEADSQKEIGAEDLSLHCENSPAKGFIKVVRARNVAKAPSLGNSASCSSRFAEVSEDAVALEVEELKAEEEAEQSVME